MACNINQYNLGIRNILLGKDTKQKTCIFTKADVSASLAGKYFVMHTPTNAKHVFWFKVGLVGTDPAIPNSTSHEVAILTNDSASAVATALHTVIAALNTLFTATVSSNEVEVTNVANGYAYETRDALDTLKQTSFNITTAQFGSVQVDLGPTNGDITFTVAEVTKEIKAPQFGDFLLAEIRRGASVTSSFELKDTSKTAIRRALNFYGSTIVSDDAASETISGYGSSNLFKSTDDVATQLILRPTEKAADADASEDLTIHKCKLKLGELTLSAENELVLPIEALGYLDTSKSGFANLFSYGDASKLV